MKKDPNPYFSKRVIFSTFLVLLGTIVLFRLGLWQISRYYERQAFNNQYLGQQAAPILDLGQANWSELENLEYRNVLVSGVYDNDSSIARVNQYHDGVLGYALMTPLILPDGRAIYIDRGWVPSMTDQRSPDWDRYDVNGEVSITGILRNAVEDHDPKANSDGKIWIDFYPADVQREIGYDIAKQFVQPIPSGESDPPVPSIMEVEITEGPHISYAFQWFSFGILLLFGYPFVLKKTMKHAKNLGDQ